MTKQLFLKLCPLEKRVDKALNWFQASGCKEGFTTKSVEGYATHIEDGVGFRYVYAFGHCDVVPPGDNWESMTD